MRATSALLGAAIFFLNGLSACGPEVPEPQSLATMLRPELLVEAKAWPRKEWSVSWASEDHLRLERHATVHGQLVGHDQVWISFDPPANPKLALRSWGSEGQAAWYFKNIEAQCWISSDGTGLGTPGGPDLAILCEGKGDYAGSRDACGVSVCLTSDQLVRK